MMRNPKSQFISIVPFCSWQWLVLAVRLIMYCILFVHSYQFVQEPSCFVATHKCVQGA